MPKFHLWNNGDKSAVLLEFIQEIISGWVQNEFMRSLCCQSYGEREKQTISLHVYKCKLIHVDPMVNEKFIEVLKQEYESIFEDRSGKMTVNRGKIHKYLRMAIDYTTKGLCKTRTFD